MITNKHSTGAGNHNVSYNMYAWHSNCVVNDTNVMFVDTYHCFPSEDVCVEADPILSDVESSVD